MKKCFVILIGFFPDPRMYKRIELEKDLGDLHLICWDKGNNMLQAPEAKGYTTHIIRLKSSRDLVRRLIPYMRFFRKAIKLLHEIQPDVIHVQGLDMLKIAHTYQKNSKRKVSIIYEVADLHRLLVDKQRNPISKSIQFFLCREDRRLEISYDRLLLTSMRFYEAYFNRFVPKEKIIYMPNIPDLSAFNNYKKKEGHLNFTVGFIGFVRYKQQIRNLIEAADRCGMNLLIAGFESEPVEIEPLCRNNPKIQWVGNFDFNCQIAELYGKCDVMYSVYDADMYNVRVALPNKLYEAVYCEMPLIVAKKTYLAQVVQDWGVGLAVDHKDVDELVDVLNMLRQNEEMRMQIADNCKKHKAEIDLEIYNTNLKNHIFQALGEPVG